MSFLSKLTVVAMVVLGVHALKGKRTAKAPVEGIPTRKPEKAPRSRRKIAAAATRSTALPAARNGAAPKPRSQKRSGSQKRSDRGLDAKRSRA